MNDSILSEVSDGIARIILNRPDKLNAFGEDTAEAWAKVTTEIVARDDVRVIVLSGKGRAFCAGGDVRAMATAGFSEDHIVELAHLINRGQRALLESDIPVIAAAHGTTAGGGLGVLLNSDYAIVGESSKLGSIYAKLGLTPDLTVTALLARAIGERRALQLVLQDRMLSAAEALDWGLVAEVVPDDQVLARAEELALVIANHAPHARGQAKRLVRAAYGRSFVESLHDEARTIGRALSGAEAPTLISAFIGG
ncbi:enoyl-CoA hydratase/isomerase family protein [Leucobacter sp. UT-8R-CII-1-4]|uniref:enoyl-CoA hydratase/isomerase family protein n=1 Tax=Leucobacter sp. UT-8R-CII-1-4 TaxID=3040075 RepID=UPI0024A8EEC3|nr:enoyl-CoA hydratase/isomerase family protein [Leucobacter sp. UT-8R-CII-1-4]MDI6024254.1 enoyl-CoA hydratase/isomerase family protein [Leucobacter sp. UT-8R-CII-1-4]